MNAAMSSVASSTSSRCLLRPKKYARGAHRLCRCSAIQGPGRKSPDRPSPIRLLPAPTPIHPASPAREPSFFVLSLTAGVFAITHSAGTLAGATADLGLYPDLRIALSLYGLALYLYKTLLPWGLYPQYVSGLDPQRTDPAILASVAVVVALSGLAIWQWKRRPWIAVAWAFYVVTLLPMLLLLRLDRQQYVADHHSYLATLPFALLVGIAWIIAYERNSRRAAVLTVLGGLILKQATTWSDSHTLWSRTVVG
jgi:hypothetical protein